jgi:hypothetical protein
MRSDLAGASGPDVVFEAFAAGGEHKGPQTGPAGPLASTFAVPVPPPPPAPRPPGPRGMLRRLAVAAR